MKKTKFLICTALTTLLITSLLSCQNNNSTQTTTPPETMVEQTGEELQLKYESNISVDQIEDTTILDWIELCNEDERDDIGSYILKSTSEVGDEVLHKYVIYRTGLEKEADFDISFEQDSTKIDMQISFTSTDKGGEYDLTYIEFVAPEDKRVSIDFRCDGDKVGFIVTNSSFER